MKLIILSLFCLIPLYAFNQANIIVESKEVKGQKYEVSIFYPPSFNSSEVTFPLVILLDADEKEASTYNEKFQKLFNEGLISESIVVGITWDKHTVDKELAKKRDLTFTKQDQHGGGADKFMNFINYELIPLLLKDHKADTHNKTIMGHSLGGLFILYTLFTQPQSFTNYVASNPSLYWADYGISKFEEMYFLTDAKTNKKLYMTYTQNSSGIEFYKRLVDTLKSKEYQDIKFYYQMFKNKSIDESKDESYINGMRYAFEKKNIRIHEAILKSYEGKYYASDRSSVEIVFKEDKLYLLEDGNMYILNAESETSFYSPNQYLKVVFFNNIKGFKLEKQQSTKFYKM